ncbi:MAG: hypothetical protein ACRDPA_17990, partial [Solirubrobacteraceae bacterium]
AQSAHATLLASLHGAGDVAAKLFGDGHMSISEDSPRCPRTRPAPPEGGVHRKEHLIRVTGGQHGAMGEHGVRLGDLAVEKRDRERGHAPQKVARGLVAGALQLR